MTDFEKWYDHYPLKKGRGAAKKKFEALSKKKILPDTEVLIQAVHDQIAERKHLRDKNQFVAPWKHPATWLNQECWDDVCILPRSTRKREIKLHSLETMRRAYNILSNLGMKDFESYCKQLKMLESDIEAVLCKHNGTHDVSKLPEMRGI
jgi:hypothetical protein